MIAGERLKLDFLRGLRNNVYFYQCLNFVLAIG